jgi:hypothetical protein
VEALEAVESRVHTTPEQCLMSITAIARQAQGIRAGEVISKLTSCGSTTGSTSLPRQELRQRSYKSQRQPRPQPYSSRAPGSTQPYSCKCRRTLTGWQQQS